MKIGGTKVAHLLSAPSTIVKIQKLNSTDSCVFAVFETSDTLTNLHIALDRYKDNISQLQQSTWK